MAQVQLKPAMHGLAGATQTQPEAPKWIQEPNPNATHVTKRAEFAVQKHNKNSGKKLVLEDVRKAWNINIKSETYGDKICVVNLRATDPATEEMNNYEAFIWENADGEKVLMCFRPYPPPA